MREHLGKECEHELYFEFEVNAPVDKVWRTLTTKDGLKSFFSSHVDAEFYPGGNFVILFDMEAPEGSRGSEGMIILAMEENQFLSFTWNSPPILQSLRDQMTTVIIHLEDLGTMTRIIFRNVGYGFSDEWSKSREYFQNAWGNIVLPRLKYALETGPYDWLARPELPKVEYK